jgi:hypothetical protein
MKLAPPFVDRKTAPLVVTSRIVFASVALTAIPINESPEAAGGEASTRQVAPPSLEPKAIKLELWFGGAPSPELSGKQK